MNSELEGLMGRASLGEKATQAAHGRHSEDPVAMQKQAQHKPEAALPQRMPHAATSRPPQYVEHVMQQQHTPSPASSCSPSASAVLGGHYNPGGNHGAPMLGQQHQHYTYPASERGNASSRESSRSNSNSLAHNPAIATAAASNHHQLSQQRPGGVGYGGKPGTPQHLPSALASPSAAAAAAAEAASSARDPPSTNRDPTAAAATAAAAAAVPSSSAHAAAAGPSNSRGQQHHSGGAAIGAAGGPADKPRLEASQPYLRAKTLDISSLSRSQGSCTSSGDDTEEVTK
jgi:hypothetical protein